MMKKPNPNPNHNHNHNSNWRPQSPLMRDPKPLGEAPLSGEPQWKPPPVPVVSRSLSPLPLSPLPRSNVDHYRHGSLTSFQHSFPANIASESSRFHINTLTPPADYYPHRTSSPVRDRQTEKGNSDRRTSPNVWEDIGGDIGTQTGVGRHNDIGHSVRLRSQPAGDIRGDIGGDIRGDRVVGSRSCLREELLGGTDCNLVGGLHCSRVGQTNCVSPNIMGHLGQSHGIYPLSLVSTYPMMWDVPMSNSASVAAFLRDSEERAAAAEKARLEEEAKAKAVEDLLRESEDLMKMSFAKLEKYVLGKG